jgi:hypothetical protein
MRGELDLANTPLPAPLKAAVHEFEAWMRAEALADQARSIPKGTLYHYTDMTALTSILEKQEIWCFLHSQQSDSTEVSFSLEIARKFIRQEATRRTEASRSLLLGLDDMLGNNPLGDTFDFYFFSLSTHREDRRQWNEYGRGGTGLSIGLSPALFQPDQPTLKPRATENVFVSKIIYGPNAARARHRKSVIKLADIVDRVWRDYAAVNIDQTIRAWFDAMNKTLIADLLIWNCLTAKATKYKNERETRYILLGMKQIFDDYRHKYNDRNYVTTYLPLTIPGNVVEILVGPLADKRAEDTMTAVLDSHGYPAGIPVIRSSVRMKS